MKRIMRRRRLALGLAAVALVAGCGGSKNAPAPPSSTKGTDVIPPVSSANSVARDANNQATTTLP